MDHFHADNVKLAPSAVAREFTRADLIFYGVEHRGPSYEAVVFINASEATRANPLDAPFDPVEGFDPVDGFAGSFVIFGHRACFGSEGHCDVPTDRDPFDKAPPHALTPQTKMVEITSALKHPRCEGDTISITVIPIVPGKAQARQLDVMFFTGLRLVTYR